MCYARKFELVLLTRSTEHNWVSQLSPLIDCFVFSLVSLSVLTSIKQCEDVHYASIGHGRSTDFWRLGAGEVFVIEDVKLVV